MTLLEWKRYEIPSSLQQALERREYQQALNIVKSENIIESTDDLNKNLDSRKIQGLILVKLVALNRIGKHQQALTKANDVITILQEKQVTRQNLDFLIDVLIEKANSQRRMNETTKARFTLALADYVLQEGQSLLNSDLEKNDLQSRIYHHVAMTYMKERDFEKSRTFLNRQLSVEHQLARHDRIAMTTYCLAETFLEQGRFEDALHHYFQCLDIARTNHDESLMASYLIDIGNAYQKMGKFKEAREYYHQSLQLCLKNDYKRKISIIYTNLGTIHLTIGELKQAEKFFRKALDLPTLDPEKSTVVERGWILANLGLLEHDRGNLEASEKYLKEALTQGHLDDFLKAFCYHILGNIARLRMQWEESEAYLRDSLNIYQSYDNSYYQAGILVDLILLSLERRHPDKARTYLNQLRSLTDSQSNVFVNSFYHFANALVKKELLNFADLSSFKELHDVSKDILDCQGQFKELLANDLVHHEINALSGYNLAELLLMEYRIFGKNRILTQLHAITQQLESIAKKEDTPQLLIKSHLLKAHLMALTAAKTDEIRKLLEQALTLAEEKGFHLLVSVITNYLEHLDDLFTNKDVLNNIGRLIIAFKTNRLHSLTRPTTTMDLNFQEFKSFIDELRHEYGKEESMENE